LKLEPKAFIGFGLFYFEARLTVVNIELIEKVVPEIEQTLVGLSLRQIYQLGENRFAVAFEGDDEFRLLFVSIEPRDPRIYLIRRRIRDLKKHLSHPSQFSIFAERSLLGFVVKSVGQIPDERIVEVELENISTETFTVIFQLTGTSSNSFLLDAKRTILSAARKPIGEGQEIGSNYETPKGIHPSADTLQQRIIELGDDGSISDSLDDHFQLLDSQRNFDDLSKKARDRITQAMARNNRLIKISKTTLSNMAMLINGNATATFCLQIKQRQRETAGQLRSSIFMMKTRRLSTSRPTIMIRSPK
jgi:predicted ribosome quality control (RQC) complex YloA/Tae2 family protein